jgi:hypothetical protein
MIVFSGLYILGTAMSVKKVPQRRNSLAGKGKKKASAKKKAYDAAYHATPERKAYRAKLNKENRLHPNNKGEDKSHTSSGRLVNESRSKNRARQGKGGRSPLRSA